MRRMHDDHRADDYVDPGWKLALKRSMRFLVPWLPKGRSLVDLRAALLGLVIFFAVLADAVRWIGIPRTFESVQFLDILVAGWSVIAVSETVWVGRKLISSLADAESEENLAAVYRTYFFIRIGIWDLPALLGLAVAYIGGGAVDYWIGAAVTIAGLLSFAPTKRRITSLQARISQRGSHLSLGRALVAA